MKRDNKALYEKIMQNVSKVVKKTLYESSIDDSEDYILDKFLGDVYRFCVANALGNNGVKYLIAAYTDEQKFLEMSKLVNISRGAITTFEETLDDETYDYMVNMTEIGGNGDITFDEAYTRFCELYN